MKCYTNDIYPIALVLSKDVESVNKEYYNTTQGPEEDIKIGNSQATTYFLTRRTKEHCNMAVGIVFNIEPTTRLKAHEAFHATRMMLDYGVNIPLTDSSEEAYAYLQGWIAECIEDFFK
jgi:hypothetical protein